MSKMSLKFILLLVAVVLMAEVIDGGALGLRSARSPKQKLPNRPRPENEPCVATVPCAWAVYIRPGREVDYYVYNCQCTGKLICTKDEDDLSITAFVYRCKPDTKMVHTNRTTAITSLSSIDNATEAAPAATTEAPK